MAIEVKAPDGAVISFPDNTSEDVIKQQMQKYVASAGQQPQATPAAQEENPKPGVWERFSKNFGDASRGTLAGSINLAASGGGEEQGRIRALQSQMAAEKNRGSWLGAPDKAKIQSLAAQIEQLNGRAEQKKMAAQTAEANRKQQYEDMPAAQGFVENAAALVGQVAGSLATPETFLPGIGLAGKAAPQVVRAGAGLGERLMAKVTAPGMGKAAAEGAAGTAAVNAAVDVPAQQIASGITDEDYSLQQTINKGLIGAALGAPLAIGTRIFKTPVMMTHKYPTDQDVVDLANSQLSRVKALKPGISEMWANATETIRQKAVWAGTPLYRLQQDAGQMRNIMDADHSLLTSSIAKVDLVGQAQLLRGVGKQTEYALTEGTFNFTPDRQAIVHGGGPSLAGILEAMGDDGNLRAIQYMVGKRAIDLTDRRGITTGFSPDDMDRFRRVVAHGDQLPHYQVFRNQWNDYMGWLLDFQRQGGLHSADEIVRIRAENPDYISFFRQNDQERVFGRSGVGKTKQIHGGVEPFADFMGNTVDYINRSIEATNKNIFKQSLYNDWLPSMSPDVAAKWAIKADKSITATFNLPEAQLRSQLKKMVANDPAAKQAIDNMTLTDMRLWYSRQENIKGGNFDVVYNDGKATVYKIVDQRLNEFINSLAPKQLHFNKMGLEWLNKVEDVATGTKSWFTSVVTKNPGFAFIANPIRDTLQAMITGRASKTPIGLVGNDFRSVMDLITDSRDYKLFMLNGGGFSNISSTEAKSGLKDMYLKAGIDLNKSVLNSSDKYDNWLQRQFGHYTKAAEKVENINRYSEYKGLLDQGANARLAALAGRNVSVDFGRQGSAEWLQFLSSVTPFLNTTIQSVAKEFAVVGSMFNKTASKDLKIKAWAAGTAMMTASVSAHMWNMYGSDGRYKQEYQNLPDYIRDTHIVIFYPGEKEGQNEKITIPLPYGFGLLFGALPSRFAEMVDMQNISPVTASVGNYIKNTFNISANPAFKTGIAALQTAGVMDPNEATTFTGSPVIPQQMQALSEGVTKVAQKHPTTGTFFVQAGEATGASPLMLEHTARQAAGWLVDAFNSMYDAGPGRSRREMFGEKAGAEVGSVSWVKDALFSRLIKTQPASYTKDEEKLHALMAKAKAEQMFFALKDRRVDMMETYQAASSLYPALGYMDATNKTLADVLIQADGMRDAINMVQQNKGMTGPEKREEIMKITQARNMILSTAVGQLLSSEIDSPVEGMGTPMNDTVYGKKRFAEGGYVAADDADAELARRSGFGYGTGYEEILAGRGNVAQIKDTDIRDPIQLIEAFKKTKPSKINEALANEFMKAALDSNRSSITGLGFDPHKTGTITGEAKNLDGYYGFFAPTRRKGTMKDTTYKPVWGDYIVNVSGNDKQGTISHESAHRGIDQLSESKRIDKDYNTGLFHSKDFYEGKVGLDDEVLVRIMTKYILGDKDVGLRSNDQYVKNFAKFPESLKINKDFLALLEKEAAQEIKRRKPGGPR